MCVSVYLKQILEENEPSFCSQFLLTLQRENVGPALCTAQKSDGGQRVKLGVQAPAQNHGARHSRATGKIQWGWRGGKAT